MTRQEDVKSCYEFIASHVKSNSTITNCESIKNDLKSSEKSELQRQRGNDYLNSKNYSQACEQYTKSLFLAETNNDLAFAYGNRSAALYRLGYYDDCLADIKRAIQFGYPNDHRLQRLYTRAGNAHEQLKIHYLNLASVGGDDNHKSLVKFVSAKHPHCKATKPGLSEQVEIRQCPEKGFGIYCKTALPIGTVVIYEAPFTSRLHTDLLLTHCYGCYTRCWTLLPCPGCSIVGFCSVQCQMESFDSDTNQHLHGHKWECGFLKSIIHLDGDIGLLAYACVARVPSVLMCSTMRQLVAVSSTMQTTPSAVASALLLSTNFHLRSEEDKTARAKSAWFYTNLLQKVGYFATSPPDQMEEDKILVCSAMFIFLQSVATNAHTTAESVQVPYMPSCQPEFSPIRDFIHGLYPFLSMINHSCDPNVVRIGYNCTHVALKLLRPLKQGDELFDNYSTHVALCCRAERQRKLQQQYCFQCQCIACEENWPLYEDLVKQCCDAPVPWKCRSAATTQQQLQLITNCPLCDTTNAQPLLEHLETIKMEAHDLFNQSHLSLFCENATESRLKELISTLEHYAAHLHAFCARPHVEFDFVNETLKWCWQLGANCATL